MRQVTLKIIILVFALTLIISGCKKSGNVQIDDLNKYANIRSSVQDELNFDLWWKGPYSHFMGLQGKKIKIKLYSDNGFVLVYLDTYLSNQSYSGYYGLQFSPNKDNSFELVGLIPFSNPKDIEDYLKTSTYYGETEVQMGNISQPSFGPLTNQKKYLLTQIEEKLPLALKNEWNFKKGNYKVYVKNFKNNSSDTLMVIENQNGDLWFGGLGINSGNVEILRVTEIIGPREEYEVKQIKAISFLKKIEVK